MSTYLGRHRATANLDEAERGPRASLPVRRASAALLLSGALTASMAVGADAAQAAAPAAAAARPAVAAAPVAVPAGANSSIVNIARGLSGVPYRWGGTTPAGFDCSGFTQYVYAKAGISIPRTSQEQQRRAIRVSHPRPGDLVFFGNPAYHVGIYAGNGMVYDAQRPGTTTGLHVIWTPNVSYGRF